MSTAGHGSGNSIHARQPRGSSGDCRRVSDELEGYLDDAAHYPGGHARALCFPRSEAEIARLLRCEPSVLAIGSQSSLTGGATPRGETLISTTALNDVGPWLQNSVRVGAGVVLAELEPLLRERDLYYPPVPTYDGASVGGTVATNAAGAATFKYGSTRRWIRALTVVLACGEVLDITRGEVCCDSQGRFVIVLSDGSSIEFEVPSYTMPAVPKCSSGYYAEPGMDLIDLFIGSEGTLGVVTELELTLASPRPARLCGFVALADDRAACALAAELRSAAQQLWAGGEGIDVAAIEYLDRRCLELLVADGADRRAGFSWSAEAGAALIFQVELPSAITDDQVAAELAAVGDHSSPLARLAGLLGRHGVFEQTIPVLPDQERRRRELFALREAVPEALNRRVKQAQREVDACISKAAADVIVPFERFEQSLSRYRELLERRGLDHAIWGHISDGNVHPNVIAASAADMQQAGAAMLEIGRVAIALGGCPMSEHGVGRNPTKQALLKDLYGEVGIESMRRVKRALDPSGALAPGVIFDG